MPRLKVGTGYRPQVERLDRLSSDLRGRLSAGVKREELVADLCRFWGEWPTAKLGSIELAVGLWATLHSTPVAKGRLGVVRAFAGVALDLDDKRASEWGRVLGYCLEQEVDTVARTVRHYGGVYGMARHLKRIEAEAA